MKIKSIKKVGQKPVYDLSVADVEHYVLENGVVTHNTGMYYSANNIYIIGRQMDKEGKDLMGHNFMMNVEKSRSVKEKAIIPINVTFEGGIDRYSGLLDVALITGHVVKPKLGWYSRPCVEDDKSWRKAQTSDDHFWEPIFNGTDFFEKVKAVYALEGTKMFSEDIDFDPETGEIVE